MTKSGIPLQLINGEWTAPCMCRFHIYDGPPGPKRAPSPALAPVQRTRRPVDRYEGDLLRQQGVATPHSDTDASTHTGPAVFHQAPVEQGAPVTSNGWSILQGAVARLLR